jgi:hypothetical protein
MSAFGSKADIEAIARELRFAEVANLISEDRRFAFLAEPMGCGRCQPNQQASE